MLGAAASVTDRRDVVRACPPHRRRRPCGQGGVSSAVAERLRSRGRAGGRRPGCRGIRQRAPSNRRRGNLRHGDRRGDARAHPTAADGTAGGRALGPSPGRLRDPPRRPGSGPAHTRHRTGDPAGRHGRCGTRLPDPADTSCRRRLVRDRRSRLDGRNGRRSPGSEQHHNRAGPDLGNDRRRGTRLRCPRPVVSAVWMLVPLSILGGLGNGYAGACFSTLLLSAYPTARGDASQPLPTPCSAGSRFFAADRRAARRRATPSHDLRHCGTAWRDRHGSDRGVPRRPDDPSRPTHPRSRRRIPQLLTRTVPVTG